MQQIPIYFKSDFKLFIQTEAGFAVPFKFEFYTNMPSRPYIVKFDGHKYHNCELLEDGRLCIAFDDHGFGLGKLMIRQSYYLNDADYASEICDRVIAPQPVVNIDDNLLRSEIVLALSGDDTIEFTSQLPPYYQAGLTPEEHQALIDATVHADEAAASANEQAGIATEAAKAADEARQALTTAYNEKVAALDADYAQKKSALEADYAGVKDALSSDYASVKAQLDADYAATKEALSTDYATALAGLNDRMTAIESQFSADREAWNQAVSAFITASQATFDGKLTDWQSQVDAAIADITRLQQKDEEQDQKLSELEGEIKSNKSIHLIVGGYYNSSTIGAVPTFVENSGYRYAQYSCLKGQVFKIQGVGASIARLWYTLDADGKIVRNAASAETSLQEVTIESGEVVIGYNSGATNTYIFELTTSVPVIAQGIVKDYNEKISKVISDGKDFVRTKVFEPIQGKYFNVDGVLANSPIFSYLIIKKSDIVTDVLSWYPYARGTQSICAVVYFGVDGSVLGKSIANTFFSAVADFPEGTETIGFSFQISTLTDGKVTMFGVRDELNFPNFYKVIFPFGGKTGIVFGDSIMNGVGTEVGYDAPNVMQDYMHCRIYNGGVGGATYKLLTHIVDGFLNNDWTYVDSEIESVSSSSALRPLQVLPKRYATIKNLDLSNIDFLVFAYGTNDWTSNMVLDNESNPMDTETILGCIRSSVSRLQSAYPNLEIFIITPSYRVISRDSNGDVLTDSDNVRHQGLLLGELSDKIAECAKTLKLPCWNQYWDNGVNRYNATRWLSDGTHRTKEGYRLLGRQMADFMNAH